MDGPPGPSATRARDWQVQDRARTANGARRDTVIDVVGTAGRYVITNRWAGSVVALWVIGLCVAFLLPAPVQITPSMMAKFEKKIVEVDRIQSQLHFKEEQLMRAKLELSSKLGWFPWFASAEAKAGAAGARAARDALQREVAALSRVSAEAERRANRELGLFSAYGVAQAKEKFWRSFEHAKRVGKRNTFIDGIFAILSNRDQELLEILARLALYLVLNMAWAMFFMFWVFLFSLPHLIWTFGATWVESAAFFLLAAVAAASVMATFVGAVAGAAGGATLAIAGLVGHRGPLLTGRRPDGRRRLRGHPVPGYTTAQFGRDHYYRAVPGGGSADPRPHSD